MMAGRIYSEHVIAFIDVLGFGSLVDRSGQENSGDIINVIANTIEDSRKFLLETESNFSFQFTQFSDSFVISLESKSVQGDYAVFGMAMQRVIEEFLFSGMLLRGGITVGSLLHTKDLLFGPAMNRAYFLESSIASFPRVIVDPDIELDAKAFFPATLRVDKDGLQFVDYFNLNKMFYLKPIVLALIRKIVEGMAGNKSIKKKRDWMVKKYNEAVSDFDLMAFEERLSDRAFEKKHIADRYEEYLQAARSVARIS